MERAHRVHIAPEQRTTAIPGEVDRRGRQKRSGQSAAPARAGPLLGVGETRLDQPPASSRIRGGAPTLVNEMRLSYDDGENTSLAESALEIDLLGVHEEGLIESADGPESRRREQHGGPDDPVHCRGATARPRVVTHGPVELGPQSRQGVEPLDDLLADAGEATLTTAGSHGSAAVMRFATKSSSMMTSLLRIKSNSWRASVTPVLTLVPKPPLVARRMTSTPGR